MDTIRTERLILRSWREQDRAPFRALNADPRAMAFLGGVLSAAQSDALVDRIEAHFRRYGFGLAAAERTESGTFIGYVGLAACTIAPFESSIEIGWRLAAGFWNRGLATEGAQAIVHYAFETLGLSDLISFTAAVNTRSRRVMEKLGMTHDRASDFDHPNLPDGHPLRPHVLYRLHRPNWLRTEKCRAHDSRQLDDQTRSHKPLISERSLDIERLPSGPSTRQPRSCSVAA